MRSEVRFTLAATVLLAALAFAACSTKDGKGSAADSGRAQSQALGDSAKMIAQNLMKFDTLDFDVFSNQRYPISKSPNTPSKSRTDAGLR